PELNPVCSRSGKKIAFVKDDAVVVLDVASKKTTRISAAGSSTHHWGLPEFIAEEEMDRHEGMWWAPDEKSLLVFEVNEDPVGKKVRAQIFADHTEMFEQRYPAAGEKNALVHAWLISVDGNKKREINTPTEDGYLARGGFFWDSAPFLEWESRDQKTLRVLDGERVIFEEKDPVWIDLSDDLVPLKDNKRLLWSTEKSGRRQIVVVDRKTGAFTELTHEPEAVRAVEAVDDASGTVFFSAFRERGRTVHALSIALTGGEARDLTPEMGSHGTAFDDQGHFFVDRASDFGVPPKVSVRDATGKVVLVVDDNPAAELARVARSQPQWLDIVAADGSTKLNGLLLPPTHVEPGKRYPVIVNIYGGPGASTVVHAWTRSFPVQTFWTEHGYGVFLVDNRGMAGRDRAFTRAHDHAFGDVEVKDLFAAVEQLKAVPWVDGKRLGVFGWSYGGFLAARAILDEHTPFAAAVAVAPVTDWTLYDTHYTERYLGMPPGKAYDAANLVQRAPLLQKPFLLVHGTADDNVLFEHSLRLIEALEKADRRFQLMIYPGKAHGISGKPAQLSVYDNITDFFDTRLR
ncbi:MAG TPA: alpha/beta fold hydrolase, partial [Myxococcota bacterium]